MKKIISVFLLILLLMSLCSCESSMRTEPSESIAASEEQIKQNEKKSFIGMQLNVLLSLEELAEANHIVIAGLEKLKEKNMEASRTEYIEALAILSEAEQKIESVIDSPNFIQTNIEILAEKYEETVQILGKGDKISEEEYNQFILLEGETAILHVSLIKSVQCFSNLYSIREFDKLPDEEAGKKLKEKWWEFRFEEEIKCPETIEEQDLYLIWARQFTEADFTETDEFMNELQALREDDDLTSKNSNKAWADFVETYILGTETGAVNTSPNILFLFI